MNNQKTITVCWTGSWPSLCCGEWKIIINGIVLTGIENSSFGTEGDYDSWYFDENWSEVFETYFVGKPFSEEWLNTNGLSDSLLRHGLVLAQEEKLDLYEKIQSEDWRNGSCGGCI